MSSVRPDDAPRWSYGTAGFRGKASGLHFVAYRVGIAAALRAKRLNATVGVMITASHNPVEDNGVKIIDSTGGMLARDWEQIATELVNVPEQELAQHVDAVAAAQLKPEEVTGTAGCRVGVFVARDTRPSGLELVDCLKAGIGKVLGDGQKVRDLGLLTTPQLHFLVYQYNRTGDMKESAYFSRLTNGYLSLCRSASKPPRTVYLDCACGIASLKLSQLNESLKDTLKIVGFNTDTKAHLNDQCGADFVKVAQTFPKIHSHADGVTLCDFKPGDSYASVDGDADRLVYYYKDSGTGRFQLLDGDKIAALIAGFIQTNLKAAGLDDKLSMCVVQTAYANGASRAHLAEVLGLEVVCVPTGVKHLHATAERYDVGVYFEANGHGTVLFSGKAEQLIGSAAKDDAQSQPLASLQALMQIMNPAIGDAFSLLLAVEAILSVTHCPLTHWNVIYRDLPCLQLKVHVADRTAIETEDAERRVSRPTELQSTIDRLVDQLNDGSTASTPPGSNGSRNGLEGLMSHNLMSHAGSDVNGKKHGVGGNSARAFVRPSGTEDVVRVYAEAATPELANRLATDVARAVWDLAGGVGQRP